MVGALQPQPPPSPQPQPQLLLSPQLQPSPQPLPPLSLQPPPPSLLRLQSQPQPQSLLHAPAQAAIDPRFGFFPSPPQPPPSAPRSQLPAGPPSPSPTVAPVRFAQHVGQDASDIEISPDDGEDNNEPKEIDETSDSEDERRAHELLQAAPTQATAMGGNTLVLLPYDNRDFAVRFTVCEHPAPTSSHTMQELSSDQSVLQQHYTRNKTLKAPAPVPLQRRPAPVSTSTPSQPPSDGRLTLDAYPPLWREVIANAKKTFRAYLAGTNGFPNPAEAVEEARECLEDALAVLHEEQRMVEASKWNHYSRWDFRLPTTD